MEYVYKLTPTIIKVAAMPQKINAKDVPALLIFPVSSSSIASFTIGSFFLASAFFLAFSFLAVSFLALASFLSFNFFSFAAFLLSCPFSWSVLSLLAAAALLFDLSVFFFLLFLAFSIL